MKPKISQLTSDQRADLRDRCKEELTEINKSILIRKAALSSQPQRDGEELLDLIEIDALELKRRKVEDLISDLEGQG
jgi:hypothetical protein